MSVEKKPLVFVIMPFREEMFALYEKLKSDFGHEFEFTNAGDLGNQQNILKDIVGGIYQADIVIADLTGHNPNVFYELGLAHAMNKKVIIITQNMAELPFDIKAYRTLGYSLLFYKFPDFLRDVYKLLRSAMDGSAIFGNPVADYIPNYFLQSTSTPAVTTVTPDVPMDMHNAVCDEQGDAVDSADESGYLDYIADIIDNSQSIVTEINEMGVDMQGVSQAIIEATSEINRVKLQSGSADPTFVRSVCRKLADPIEVNAERMKAHVSRIGAQWGDVENSYLSLLDNRLIQNVNNLNDIESSSRALDGLRDVIKESDNKIDELISCLRTTVGVEKRLTKAITKLIAELESYLSMTDKMSSSIDRIIAKSEIVVCNIKSSVV